MPYLEHHRGFLKIKIVSLNLNISQPFGLTMHEFEELVNHGLQELPVCAQESRVLANDVHNIGSDDGFVILSSFLLTQTQEILNKQEVQLMAAIKYEREHKPL